jgi:hypothetical protein
MVRSGPGGRTAAWQSRRFFGAVDPMHVKQFEMSHKKRPRALGEAPGPPTLGVVSGFNGGRVRE